MKKQKYKKVPPSKVLTRKQLAYALKTIRQFHRLTMRDLTPMLAAKSDGYISLMEKGTSSPTVDYLNRYALAFDMKISSIIAIAESSSDHPINSSESSQKAQQIIQWMQAIPPSK